MMARKIREYNQTDTLISTVEITDPAVDTADVTALFTLADGDQRRFTLEEEPTELITFSAAAITASDSLSGRTLTITVDSTTGVPAPDTTLTVLTLDGVDVLGAESGTGPWTYTPPDDGSQRTVAWTVTTSNGVGVATTASGSKAVTSASFTPVDFFASGEGGRYGEARPDTVFASADGTGAVSIGDAVGYNADLSPNGNHITQGSTPAKPLFGQTVDGIYSLTTDGVDDYIDVAWPALLNTPVTRAFAGVQSNGRFMQDALDVDEERLHVGITSDNELSIYAGKGVTTPKIAIPNQQTNIFAIVVFNGASSRAIINGVKYDQIGDPGPNTRSNGFRTGAENKNPATNFTAVEIFSDLTLDRDITQQEETDLIAYLSGFANVSLP